jgi:hypothetical protein
MMLRMMALFLALSGIAAAQSSVQIDFGIRGGLLPNSSFQANQLCSGAGCVFGTRSFNAQQLSGTLGPTAGVLIGDRVEVRFEAARRRFAHQVRYDLMVPFEQHELISTRGHFWEYPLLLTYRLGSGPARPFAGGGASIAASGTYSTERSTTSTTLTTSGPITTSLIERKSGKLTGLFAFYISGGLDGRVPYFSIRPELRWSRFLDDASTSTATIRPNQFEILIGISHSRRFK